MTDLKNARVAIIGAGGFLGSHLSRYLAPLVQELICFGRSRAYPEYMTGVTWVGGTLAGGAIKEAVEGCNIVIHLASSSTPANADRNIVADAEENIVGSLRLLDCCVDAGVSRVVFISSGGTVYGIPQQIPTPESCPMFPITAYGVAKLAIEKYLEVYRHQRGLDYRVLRVSNLYGPLQTAGKGQGVIAAFLARALQNQALEIWGDGQVVRDYVYVADVVKAIEAAMLTESSARTFNIGSGHGLSLLDVISGIEKEIGHSLARIFRAGRPVDVPRSILDCTLAREQLGWQAVTDIGHGLAYTALWMKEAMPFIGVQGKPA